MFSRIYLTVSGIGVAIESVVVVGTATGVTLVVSLAGSITGTTIGALALYSFTIATIFFHLAVLFFIFATNSTSTEK